MQVSSLFAKAIMALFVQSGAACTISQDCCWGGNDAGLNGCENQHHPADKCHTAAYEADFCFRNGVTVQDCDADCCSISTKWGRVCP
ncbi:hypothetical protein WAI453_007513 [Rhynchosporium graminicola]